MDYQSSFNTRTVKNMDTICDCKIISDTISMIDRLQNTLNLYLKSGYRIHSVVPHEDNGTLSDRHRLTYTLIKETELDSKE
jgi:hypothetical protein